MSSKYPHDDELFKRIKEGDQLLLKKLHGQYWIYFYSYFKKRKNLNHEAILDIYANSFTTFYINIRDGKLVAPLKCKLKTYLIAIGIKYRLKYFDDKNRNKEDPLDDEDLEKIKEAHMEPEIENQHNEEDLSTFIKELLNKLDANCKQLLTLKYIKEFADDAIAKKMNIASTGAVRQRRFKCLEKLRNLLDNN